MFGYDESAGGEQARGGGAAKQAENLLVFVSRFIGWIEVDDVLRASLLREAVECAEGGAFVEHEVARDAEELEVGADGFDGGGCVLSEVDVERAAGDGFDANGTGAGVEVDEARAGDARADDVEECLAQAVTGGTGLHAAGSGEDAGAEFAGDDAHEPSVVPRSCADGGYSLRGQRRSRSRSRF